MFFFAGIFVISNDLDFQLIDPYSEIKKNLIVKIKKLQKWYIQKKNLNKFLLMKTKYFLKGIQFKN